MSSSLDRQVAAYLDPKQYALFIGYCEQENMGKSEGLKTIVKFFFSTIPYTKQREYLKQASDMVLNTATNNATGWHGNNSLKNSQFIRSKSTGQLK